MSNWSDIAAVVDRALSVDAVQRANVIAEACNGDPELRREVESLLRACEDAGGFLEAPALAAGPQLDPEQLDQVPVPMPERIAEFRIRRVLGVGGMGVVYVAEQERPRRTVALKVIKPGVATPSVLRRFEHEAEVLGRLHHSGIAQIYQAGTADGPSGPQPYFAMELIDGKPITVFAEERRLSTRRRLELLARVCDAVQHAHQQGVIHRDLKPSNILIDPSGQPKILDFGVARVSRADGSPVTLRTQAGQIIGTLAYMSPEQAAGDSVAVDTRSDVYSVGVVGYQLLSGKLPLELSDKPLHEAVRAIHDQEPTELRHVSASLGGDVDVVVRKAIRKARQDRYQSAAEFAADMRRCVANEPILAKSHSTLYHIVKFSRRHPARVALVVTIIASVCLGLVITSIAAARLRAAATQEAVLRRDAEVRRMEAQATLDFLGSMLQSATSFAGGSPEMRVIDLVEWAGSQVDERFADSPAAAATTHLILGQAFQSLGRFSDAERHLSASLTIRRDKRPDQVEEIVSALHGLAWLRQDEGKLDEARVLLSSAVDDASRAFGPTDERTMALRIRLANIYTDMCKYDEAASVLKAIIDGISTERTRAVPLGICAKFFLALNRQLAGDLAAAELLLREVASSPIPADPQFPNVVEHATESLSQLLSHAGKDEEAVAVLEELLERRLESHDLTSEIVLGTRRCLAWVHRVAGRTSKAAEVTREIVNAKSARLGLKHPEVLSARLELWELDAASQKPQEAMSALQALRAEIVGVVGVNAPLAFRADELLVSQFESAGERDEALRCVRDLVERQSRYLGVTHADTLSAQTMEAGILARAGRLAEAETLYGRLVQECTSTLGRDHDTTLVNEGWYGVLLMLRGDLESAEAPIKHAVDGFRTRYGESHPFTRQFAAALADLESRIESQAVRKEPRPDQ